MRDGSLEGSEAAERAEVLAQAEPRGDSEWASLLGREVVLDVDGGLTYVGVLQSAGAYFVELAPADVHEMGSGRTTKEVYIMEAARLGSKPNRKRVLVRSLHVKSVSALDDIIVF